MTRDPSDRELPSPLAFPSPASEQARAQWNDRYRQKPILWSGKPNASLVALVKGRRPTSVLDLGCGEGGDVLWLAQQGWQASGVDISDVAIDRARARAAELGVEASFEVADLTSWQTPVRYDLIVTSFLQSFDDFDRIPVLAAALDLLTPGGELISVAHGSAPSYAEDISPDHAARMVDARAEAKILHRLRPTIQVVLAESWTRQVTSPEGQKGNIEDAIMVLRKKAPSDGLAAAVA